MVKFRLALAEKLGELPRHPELPGVHPAVMDAAFTRTYGEFRRWLTRATA